MKIPFPRLWPRALVAGILFAALAPAVTVPKLSFERVVASSERIVHGRVLRVWTAWDSERRFIWTHAEVAVDESLKGDGATLTLSAPGGTLDGMTMPIAGAARFTPGEELVAFAYRTGSGLWRLRGWGQGVYRVERGPGGLRVAAQIGEARLADTGAPAAAEAAPPADLDGFLDAVRARVAQEAGR